ncbi:MAG: hypothetical protein ACXAB2_06765 [Candidatus Hodarchaeales archaeon]|jgi:hypothetical protein
MVSLSTGSIKTTGKIVLPLLAGGVLGEFIDQSGYDEALINAIPGINMVPEQFKPFIPITVGFIALLILGGAALKTGSWQLTGLVGAAIIGIMTNYAAKMVLKSGGSK